MCQTALYKTCTPFLFLFLPFDFLSVLRGHSFFSSPPQRPMLTSDFEGFSVPDFIHYIYFPIFILEKVFFPCECSVLNKGTTSTIFITSLVWRGPWLGIEPGTSRTQSQHYTTRLSRRQWTCNESQLPTRRIKSIAKMVSHIIHCLASYIYHLHSI